MQRLSQEGDVDLLEGSELPVVQAGFRLQEPSAETAQLKAELARLNKSRMLKLGRRIRYLLGMWVQLDSGPAYRVDNAPATVEVHYAARVVPGVTVPLRIAQVRPGVTMSVLEWEKL